MKVYLLTTGEYSDYHVMAVFETEEDAKKSRDLLCKIRSENYDIEEFDLIKKGDENIIINKTWLKCSYNFIKKETKYWETIAEYEREELIDLREKIKVYSVDVIYYYFYRPLNVKNLLQIEKIMADKVKELEYELHVLYGGDMKHFLNHMKRKGVDVYE